MRRRIALVILLALIWVSATPAFAASDQASCVGTFSQFFAQGGDGTHRSEVATDFAHNARPAGLNVYSQVAKFHGSLEDC